MHMDNLMVSPICLKLLLRGKMLYLVKALLLASSAKFSLFSSLSPKLDKGHDSAKSTSVHEETEQATVFGPEDQDCAHKMRMTILNLHARNVDDVVQALENNQYFKQMQLMPNIVDGLLQKFGDDWKSALGFFLWVDSRPGYQHTSYAYNKIVDLLGKTKQMDRMWDMVEKLRIGGFMTLETVTRIMRRLAGSGKWRDAVSFFDDLGHLGFTKDTESMNLLLDALCKEKKAKVAREVFIELKACIQPDAYTYNILVNGWCNVHRIEEALWTIKEMRGNGFLPSVITYSTILKAYCKKFNYCKVFELLDEMVTENCPPNVVSFTIIINSLAGSLDAKELVSVVVKRMKSSGCKPDARFYNALIYTLGKVGLLDNAFHVFNVEMGMNGIIPDLSTYNTMISLYCDQGQKQNALGVLRQMESSSCKPVLQTYFPLLKLCFKMGKLDDQLKSFLSDMETKHHLSLDLDAYTLLIHGLCSTRNVEWAYFLFDEMIDREIFPRNFTCRLLMDLAEHMNMNEAKDSIIKYMNRSKFCGATDKRMNHRFVS